MILKSLYTIMVLFFYLSTSKQTEFYILNVIMS